MPNKTEQYDLHIKNGYPPPKGKTRYDLRLPEGALSEIAKRLQSGQFVENLSAGSAGKLRKIVEDRGLICIQRRAQGQTKATVYVVDQAWLDKNPE